MTQRRGHDSVAADQFRTQNLIKSWLRAMFDDLRTAGSNQLQNQERLRALQQRVCILHQSIYSSVQNTDAREAERHKLICELGKDGQFEFWIGHCE
jgi:hypothetical protein